MAKLSTIQISGSGTYVQVTDHASAPSPTANKLYANTTSIYWEDTDLAAGGGDAMDKVKSQGPTTDGAVTTTGLANTVVLMASGANTAINILFDQGTTLAGAYNTTIHVAGDVNMPGLAITSDGTNGSQTINDLSATDHTITATADVHHDSGGSISLRMAGNGFGSGTDTAYNDTAIHFDGTADDLVIADHDDWNCGFDDFTIEGWSYRTSDTTQQVLCGGSGGTAATFFAIRMEGGGFKTEYTWVESSRLKERHFVNELDLIIANTEQTKDGRLLTTPALVIKPYNDEMERGVFSHHISKLLLKKKNIKFYLYFLFLDKHEEIAISHNTGTGVWGCDYEGFEELYEIIQPSDVLLEKFEKIALNVFNRILSKERQIMMLEDVRNLLERKLVYGKIRLE